VLLAGVEVRTVSGALERTGGDVVCCLNSIRASGLPSERVTIRIAPDETG
jgi:hypothetical protein